MTDEPTIDHDAATVLEGRMPGTLLRPGDAGYDEARTVWNGMIDRRPALIARCRGADDVVAAVDFARENDLTLSVRGGGHSVAGRAVCDDGLMIDLTPMSAVQVDAEARTARVGRGATWGDFDEKAQEHGLATTGGLVSSTGVGGLTLGGGIGYLARAHGLAADNLIACDVVTADGRRVRASEDENPDLFWGLRGGGGNFGIVTSFEFRLHEVGPGILTAQAFHPADAAREVLEFYRDFTADAPDEVMCYALVAHVPPAPPFPEESHGDTTVALVAAYAGEAEEGRPVLEPVASYGDPILAFAEPMPYTALQQAFDDGTPEGGRYYWKSHFLDALTDEVIETLVRHVDPLPGAYSMVGFEHLQGAVGRVPATDTAFPERDAAFSFGAWAGWIDSADDEEMIGWTRRLHDAMAPHATGGVYTNYLDQDEDGRVEAAFGANYGRLVELKKKWDPDNLFRMNQNIRP